MEIICKVAVNSGFLGIELCADDSITWGIGIMSPDSPRPEPPAGSCRGHYYGCFAPSLAPFVAPVVVSFVLCQAFFVPCFVLW